MDKLAEMKGHWLPEAASSFAPAIDRVFLGYMVFSWLILIGIAIFMVVYGVKYRRKTPDQKATSQITHNVKLETAWIVIPTIIFFILFGWGYVDYIDAVVVPDNATEIKITAEKWSWEFKYPGGVKENELVVPVNQPIRLLMTSRDVLHSFYVPSFRIKKDVLPNMYTTLWFEATKKGEFNVFCTEFCGTNHSQMLSKVRVVEYQEYQDWLASKATSNLTPEQMGEKIFKQKCSACHTVDGAKGIGPTWKGLYGSTRNTNLGDLKADENYLRESIEEPMKAIVNGFAPAMPPYKGQLSDEEIDGIISYIKTLQ